VEGLAELRKQLRLPTEGPLPPNFLKHADEQSIAALAAVFQAIHDHGLRERFTDWGVIAAPRFPGRLAIVQTVQRFAAEGAWGVSPHMIPHRSLHSVSGTVSQALKAHGPNFGIGGGPSAETEAFFCAAGLMAPARAGALPGLWMVLTGLSPETTLLACGGAAPGTCVEAVALALAPACAGWMGPRLRLASGPVPAPGPAPTLTALAGLLARLEEGATGLTCALGPTAHLELRGPRFHEVAFLFPGPLARPALQRRSA
jgi:hypothetical protein